MRSLPQSIIRLISSLAVLVILAVCLPAAALAAKEKQKTFASPEEAVQSLLAAARSNSDQELAAIFGPGSQKFVSSGDPVADKAGRARFVTLYEEKNRLEQKGEGTMVLLLGNEDFPYPIPLVKKGERWVFDTKAGKDELLSRRIGRNELSVIESVRAYADAQREYYARDRDGDGTREFAEKFKSTPGKQDGLFWEVREGEEQSPLGPLVAGADREGYALGKASKPAPFHGYYFKILKAQGPHAEGGAFDYVVKGKMVLGFALVAYPAQYGSSGIMTFIVNQNGVVYQKDLGKNTAKIAAKMKRFDPDKSWNKVE